MKLTTISVFLLACLSLSAAVNTQYLQGLTSPVQANIDSRVLKAGDTMTGPLVIGGGSVTASTPILDLSQTWNNGAVTFSGDKLNITDTASASASLIIDRQVGGVSRFSVTKAGLGSFSSGLKFTYLDFGATGDTFLQRSAAGILDLRNGANSQTFNVYGTYTDASNYRRLRSTMTTGGAATIAAEGLGTGVSGNTLVFTVNGSTAISIPASLNVTFGANVYAPAGNVFGWQGRNAISAPADSAYLFQNSAGTDVDVSITLGVYTSAGVRLKRVGTELQIRTGNDGAYANASMAQLTLNDSNVVLGTATGSKIGTSTTQKIGFWNATPIVQPSSTGETVGFTAGGGTTVTDASTFTGNVGATAYRLSDVVKHLKNAGLLAQ